ncbi:hypothetical protein [Microbispora sp. CA-102843]|uniref:hypothetical protein n=1 Tax=Microbispora sp. CA-102843 TaxID=3239952 RepID=UPI003D8CF71B
MTLLRLTAAAALAGLGILFASTPAAAQPAGVGVGVGVDANANVNANVDVNAALNALIGAGVN